MGSPTPRKYAMANVTELRVALTVEDFDQALAFYRDVLGLEQLADWSSGTGQVVALDRSYGWFGYRDRRWPALSRRARRGF